MGRLKQLFVCGGCGRPSAQWSGRCSSCGEWGTVSEHPVGVSGRPGLESSASAILTLVPAPGRERILTGVTGVDRVLGGGLERGSVVLLAGAPGIGKSTLILQLLRGLSDGGHRCLVASGEESRDQVAARAARLCMDGAAIAFTPGRRLPMVVAAATSEQPDVLFVDSIHAMRDPDATGLPGGASQVRGCADALAGLGKEQGITVVLVGHVTKDGDLAGPRALEHAVDVVLTFEGDPRSGQRILAAGKNRFGPEGEVAWFEMLTSGLEEREPGAALRKGSVDPGSATALAQVGRRAFAVEVQALVVPSEGTPRRQVAGLDPRRFHIVAALTDRAMSLRLSRSELYGASQGGLRLEDPGVDLAIAAALASSAAGVAPPPRTAFVGELSLTGAVRSVAGLEQRLSAARAAGVETLIWPDEAPEPRDVEGVRLIRARTIREALGWLDTAQASLGRRAAAH